jgi:ketosteroid isomerase-like protein
VRKSFEAYRRKDRALIESLLADDFTFSSPYDDRIDRVEYSARCWPNSERIRAHRIETIVEGEGEAFVLYECELTSGARFRNAERFVFEGGRIAGVEVFFGDPPTGVPKAGYGAFLAVAQRAWSAADSGGATDA